MLNKFNFSLIVVINLLNRWHAEDLTNITIWHRRRQLNPVGASDPSDQHPASVEIQTSMVSWLAAMPATPGFTANEDAADNLTFFRCGSCEAADVPVRRCKVCKVNVQLTQAGLVRLYKVNGSKCNNHGTSEYDVVSSVNEPQCIKLLRAFCSDRLDCLMRVPKASRNNLARAFITVFDKMCSQPDLLSH